MNNSSTFAVKKLNNNSKNMKNESADQYEEVVEEYGDDDFEN